MQLRKACSHPYLFEGIEPEPFHEGEHLVQVNFHGLCAEAETLAVCDQCTRAYTIADHQRQSVLAAAEAEGT